MALNNLIDPKSGQDWYAAAGILENIARSNTPIVQIPNIPFFANMLPTNIAELMDDELLRSSAATFSRLTT